MDKVYHSIANLTSICQNIVLDFYLVSIRWFVDSTMHLRYYWFSEHELNCHPPGTETAEFPTVRVQSKILKATWPRSRNAVKHIRPEMAWIQQIHIIFRFCSYYRPWWSRGIMLASRPKARGFKPGCGRRMFTGCGSPEHKSSGRTLSRESRVWAFKLVNELDWKQ